MPGSIWSAAADVQVRTNWFERVRQRPGAAEDVVAAHGRARPAVILGVFFLSLYLLTMGGHLDSPDEELMFQVTRSLAERGSMEITKSVLPQGLTLGGVDGRSY